MRGFIGTLIKKAAESATDRDGVPGPTADIASSLGLLGKTAEQKHVAHFQVMPLLPGLSLDGLTLENTGPSRVVNWLAAEHAQVCRNAQIAKPFIYTDLAKGWLPYWCNQQAGELEADRPSNDALAIAEALGAKKTHTKTLSAAHWSIAFDCYAVASAAIGSWSYAAARNHKVSLLFSFLL